MSDFSKTHHSKTSEIKKERALKREEWSKVRRHIVDTHLSGPLHNLLICRTMNKLHGFKMVDSFLDYSILRQTLISQVTEMHLRQ